MNAAASRPPAAASPSLVATVHAIAPTSLPSSDPTAIAAVHADCRHAADPAPPTASPAGARNAARTLAPPGSSIAALGVTSGTSVDPPRPSVPTITPRAG